MLFVADEIQTGFARTGRLFACEHESVVPDLITTAKGIAGGLPLAGGDRPGGADGRRPPRRPRRHLRRQPGGLCRRALGAIATIEQDDLVGAARRIGEAALPRLRELAAADARDR